MLSPRDRLTRTAAAEAVGVPAGVPSRRRPDPSRGRDGGAGAAWKGEIVGRLAPLDEKAGPGTGAALARGAGEVEIEDAAVASSPRGVVG